MGHPPFSTPAPDAPHTDPARVLIDELTSPPVPNPSIVDTITDVEACYQDLEVWACAIARRITTAALRAAMGAVLATPGRYDRHADRYVVDSDVFKEALTDAFVQQGAALLRPCVLQERPTRRGAYLIPTTSSCWELVVNTGHHGITVTQAVPAVLDAVPGVSHWFTPDRVAAWMARVEPGEGVQVLLDMQAQVVEANHAFALLRLAHSWLSVEELLATWPATEVLSSPPLPAVLPGVQGDVEDPWAMVQARMVDAGLSGMTAGRPSAWVAGSPVCGYNPADATGHVTILSAQGAPLTLPVQAA